MLVLSRLVGEVIIIDSEITIKILDVRGNKVRIGIDAPKDIPVNRKEVFEEIRNVPNC